jgi:hypothetical protein
VIFVRLFLILPSGVSLLTIVLYSPQPLYSMP